MRNLRLPNVVTAVIAAVIVTTALTILVGASPLEVFGNIIFGAFGSPDKIADILVACVPVILCASGLLFTFTAGLWNIGVEGQIIFGAIFTTWAIHALNLSTPLFIPLLILAGIIGGGFWALVVAVVKIKGGVHEIFGGLGLNFLALGTVNFLILGPWKKEGIASTSGTELFPKGVWFPDIQSLSLGPVEIILAIVALTITAILLSNTVWGVKLKAIGLNPRAALVLGIKTEKEMVLAFVLCGMFAGMAGTVQTLGLYHRLLPSISSGYGYLSILVSLLVTNQPIWIAPIAFFFASAAKGCLQLPLEMHLDSAFGGIFQSLLVLFVVLLKKEDKRWIPH